ncbi:MAG: histidinol-phosphate transaminase [Rhodospirillaceae bacterium]|nr:histidinol-phosphate transaminase [Rhodospirillaceae bacterium]
MVMSVSRRSLVGAAGGLATALSMARRQALAAGNVPDRSAPGLLRLSANENPYGPSDSAKQAMMADLANGWMYAGGESRKLAGLIAEREGVTPEHVLITEGSAEVLRIAALIYGSHGAEMIAAAPTFEQAPSYAQQNGGVMVWVPVDKDMQHDLAGMEGRITNRTGLIYVCNPNNPTATMLEAKALKSFLGAVSPRAMVLVDEAYIDLVDEPAKQSVVDQVKAGKNVIVARTFSKIHGMAGLRLGFAIARPDIIQRMDDYRMSVPNRMGLAAGTASYQDTAFMAYSRDKIRESLTMTMKALDDLGLRYTKSQANFLMFDTGRPVREFIAAMRQKNIAVGRPFPPFDTWARVSMGRVEDMPKFLDALSGYVKKA